jgi:hypothetical protein
VNDHTDNNEHIAPSNLGIGPLAGLAAGALAGLALGAVPVGAGVGLALGAVADWLRYHPPKDEEA